MSLTALTLADGQATPVDHEFTEVSEFPFALWKERLGVSIGEPRISASQSVPTKNRRSQRTQIKVEIPVLETITGDVGGYTPTPRVAYTMLGEMTFVSPDRCTLAQRKDLFAFCKNLLAENMIKAMVVDQLPAA
jgi:hypothetical protein